MAEENECPHSSVRVERGGAEKGPQCWVYIKRPGSSKEEEYSYSQFIGTPSNTEEDRLIKHEVQRQFQALEEQAKEAAKPAPAFEIIRVVADRSPAAEDFDPNRHLTINYRLDGEERHDLPVSLERMVTESPWSFPKDVMETIRAAIGGMFYGLRAEDRGPEISAHEPGTEEMSALALPLVDVPPTKTMPSPSIEKRSEAPSSIIPARLQDPRLRFTRVRKCNDPGAGVEAMGKASIDRDWRRSGSRPCDDPELLEWINNSGNYGVVCPDDLIVIDSDHAVEELEAAIKAGLPDTFTVSTGKGYHLL